MSQDHCLQGEVGDGGEGGRCHFRNTFLMVGVDFIESYQCD